MATAINREAIFQALFNLITADPAVKSIFVTTGRYLRPASEVVADTACPALFSFQLPEERKYEVRGLSPKRTLRVAYVAYFATTEPAVALPATALNAAMDAIDNIISLPGTPAGVQTLGGLVDRVYVEPEFKPYEGLLQEKSHLVATIAMLVP